MPPVSTLLIIQLRDDGHIRTVHEPLEQYVQCTHVTKRAVVYSYAAELLCQTSVPSSLQQKELAGRQRTRTKIFFITLFNRIRS